MPRTQSLLRIQQDRIDRGLKRKRRVSPSQRMIKMLEQRLWGTARIEQVRSTESSVELDVRPPRQEGTHAPPELITLRLSVSSDGRQFHCHFSGLSAPGYEVVTDACSANGCTLKLMHDKHSKEPQPNS